MSSFDLFDFEYTFDDSIMRSDIEQAIIDHYFFDEIGMETPDAFKHVFKERFKRIIEYYNKLHNTTLLSYDPLTSYKMSENLELLSNTTSGTVESGVIDDKGNVAVSNTSKKTGGYSDDTTTSTNTDTNTTGTDTEDGTGLNKNVDYPQNTISGDYRSDESDNTYSSNKTTSTEVNQSASGSSNSTGSNNEDTTDSGTEDRSNKQTTSHNTDLTGNKTENYQKTIEGITGKTYQELIQLERQNILRIKSMIIKELKPCFMMTY